MMQGTEIEKARVHLLWHVQRHTLLQRAWCRERWRRGKKNMCRKGGRAEKVLEANGGVFFFFSTLGENVMRVSHSSSHAAVK